MEFKGFCDIIYSILNKDGFEIYYDCNQDTNNIFQPNRNVVCRTKITKREKEILDKEITNYIPTIYKINLIFDEVIDE